jgi:hypothetical protein
MLILSQSLKQLGGEGGTSKHRRRRTTAPSTDFRQGSRPVDALLIIEYRDYMMPLSASLESLSLATSM